MNANERELILKDEVYQIVGAAIEVSNELGCGFLEAVYHESLAIEFDLRQVPHVPQKRIAILYKGRALYKEYIADFLCYDQIFPLDRSSLSARPDSNGGATPIRRGTANERQFGHCRSLAFIRVHSRFMRTAVSLSPEP